MTTANDALTVLHRLRDEALRQAIVLDADGWPQLDVEAKRVEAEVLLTAIEAVHDLLDAEQNEDSDDDGYSDAEADSYVLASAGYGTDEDYGYYGDHDF